MDHGFTKHALFTFDYFRRFAKYSALTLVFVASTAFTAWEATHMYVEHVELAPEVDPEVKKWEWDKEREKWAGGDGGGTDNGLGFKAAHAVRSAWIAQHWGTGGESTVLMNSKAFTGGAGRAKGVGPMNVVEARLEFAQDYLAIALKLAEGRKDRLEPGTMNALLSRHASVLELMGSRDALFEARSELERVWKGLDPATAPAERARVALKLGDLNGRLGDGEDARGWWTKAIQLTQGQADSPRDTLSAVHDIAPSSPLAQRTLVATLVSLSAHYATTGQLRPAHLLQESAIDLIRSIPMPSSFATTSPPQTLHALYLLHRSSLLSVHLAEVLYALHAAPATSISWLQNAAASSERVALALTGLPAVHPDAPGSRIPHPPASEKPLLPAFVASASLRRPASSLLRDARRSAAEAWNLIGVLTEGEGKKDSPEKALECYERALGWAGVAADRVGNIGEAGEGVLEVEWKLLWTNYVRARDALRSKPGSP